jgi:hypothetical protein
MDKLPGTVASVNNTFGGFPITAGVRWRRHLCTVASEMHASALDIPVDGLASLRFPLMLARQSENGKSSPPLC